MKRNYLLYILLTFPLFFSSCTDDDADSLNQGFITLTDLSDTVISLPCIEAKDSISFISTMPWSVDTSFADWLNLSVTTGFGGRNIKIVFNADNYKQNKKRSTEFKVCIENKNICIKVVQDSLVGFAKDKVSSDTLIIESLDSLVISTIACSESWNWSFSRETITTNDDLFSIKDSLDKNEFSLISVISRDTLYSDIEKKIYFISDNYLDSIVILRKGIFKGYGTEDSPFIISSVSDIKWIRYMAQKNETNGYYYKQDQNIELYGSISSPWAPIPSFSGIYDGNNHSIRDLYVYGEKEYQGLFGKLSNATIKGIKLYGTVVGHNYIGGICGYCESSSIDNCQSYCQIKGINNVGGIAGYSNYIISNCTNNGIIQASGFHIGGICGYSKNLINNCANASTIIDTTSYRIGGICGFSDSLSSIMNCYNTGEILGSDKTGGICGSMQSSTASILNCYNADTITSKNQNIGGIVGYNQSGKVYNCYNYSFINGANPVGAIVGYSEDATQEACYALAGTAVNLVGETKNSKTDMSAFSSDTSINIQTNLNINSKANGYLEWTIDSVGRPSFK